jgi:uncharacterized protein (TIGR03067 family)
MSHRMLWTGVVLVLLGAGPPTDEEVQKELDRFQGTWKVVRMEVGGKTMPGKAFLKVTIAFQGDEMTFGESGKLYDKITFDVDPSTKPTSADLRHTAGLKKGVRERAIYELQGDRLKLCIAEPRKKRPTEFVPEDGTGQQLLVLQRDKAAGGK